ncbi:MAG: hypothetical protein Q7U16_19680 [Agitococcus sp.]|nr:hypothetical protein [Agitococcus sp.]
MLKRHIVQPTKKIIGNVNEAITETTDLLQQSGELKSGYGLVSGVIALILATLCLLGVAAFHFPQYLTTPE